MQISEAAAHCGLSVATIRYYEHSGLIPKLGRGPDGRRRFSAENVDWLTLLYWLRATGMPMKEMKHFAQLYRAGDHTMADRKALLLNHKAQLQKRREDLDKCQDILEYKIATYNASGV